ncbi:MAG: glutathione S-transferase N-terminal domain-containing protein [Myxococcota bacterium]
MSPPDILVYTAPTMNGWKPLIFMEEAELPYELEPINLSKAEQKSDAYLRLNPNGRIPTLVDRGRDDFVVFESGAILWYLAQRYGVFLEADIRVQSETLQWLMFQVGGVGPMMGQAMYFQRIAAPNGHELPFAIERYVKESRRLLEVLDRRLRDREWLAGTSFSVADIATYPWARTFAWARVEVAGLEGLQAWLDRIDARPGVQRALRLPKPMPAFFGARDPSFEAENAARFRP